MKSSLWSNFSKLGHCRSNTHNHRGPEVEKCHLDISKIIYLLFDFEIWLSIFLKRNRFKQQILVLALPPYSYFFFIKSFKSKAKPVFRRLFSIATQIINRSLLDDKLSPTRRCHDGLTILLILLTYLVLFRKKKTWASIIEPNAVPKWQGAYNDYSRHCYCCCCW